MLVVLSPILICSYFELDRKADPEGQINRKPEGRIYIFFLKIIESTLHDVFVYKAEAFTYSEPYGYYSSSVRGKATGHGPVLITT